jgi:hypothetical protein
MALCLLHLGAFYVLVSVFSWVWVIPLSILVLINLVYQLKQAMQAYRLTLFQDLSGVLRKGNNEAISGALTPHSYLSRYLILLSFKPTVGRTLTVAVFPGSLQSEEFQALLAYINTFKSATNRKSCL